MACYRNGCLPLRDWLPLMAQMKLWQSWRASFNLVVVETLSLRDCLAAEGIGPLEVVAPGVPVRPGRPPLQLPPTVAYAGRLVPEKGVDLLLRAFATVVRDIPEAQLLLAGNGPERPALERLVAELDLAAHVSMAGHLPRGEADRYLAPAWVQAIPSRWAEPFGLVAAEAMMRGTAVVASASGGLAEIVQDGLTGFLVAPGDVQALAGALLRLLRNRDLAEALGQAGRREALARFDEALSVDRFSQMYQTLLRG
jgi:glycosyltransferase involved in cell wall biosynthesis